MERNELHWLRGQAEQAIRKAEARPEQPALGGIASAKAVMYLVEVM